MASPVPGLGARFLKALEMVPNLSMRELDELADRSYGHSSAIVQNESDRYAGTLQDFCQVLGVSLDWLVMGRGEDPDPRVVIDAVAAARTRSQGTERRSA